HTLFSQWLSNEAKEANTVKKDTPVMVVMGNPPYSVSSTNKGDWIQSLVQDYKKDLNERNIQPLSDDYIKFIRYGQHFIEQTGEGVLAFITNNSFIDGLIHRQMRKHLLQTFDEIYILDLHGNAKKKETAPDGSKDENVFDIMQGVSINLFIKNGSKITRPSDFGRVFKADLYGTRKNKYTTLEQTDFNTTQWKQLAPQAPEYLFLEQDEKLFQEYNLYFAVDSLFITTGRGTSFRKDNLLVKSNFTSKDVLTMLEDMKALSEEELLKKYSFKETKDWKINEKRSLFLNHLDRDIQKVLYRPFDFRYTYYPMDTINKIIVRGDDKRSLMHHLITDSVNQNNALIVPKQSLEGLGALVSNNITENKIVSAYNPNYIFPTYLYPEDGSERTPNLNPEEIQAFEKALNLPFSAEKTTRPGDFSVTFVPQTEFCPVDILDYIYAVLHSPSYRETYKEFLKTDFPRVPYPTPETFWPLVSLGGQIRQLHLMESPALDQAITPYP
ncbi:MAG: DNA methyltransferase, partial [Piscirickettsiaceae bacterium CG_4_10_14_0_8_um_filter_44_742]